MREKVGFVELMMYDLIVGALAVRRPLSPRGQT